MEIPQYGTVAACPNCQADTLDSASKVYHEGAEGVPCTLALMNHEHTPELLAALERHMCRFCRSCTGMWVETLQGVEPS